jgi:hypothetical protein
VTLDLSIGGLDPPTHTSTIEIAEKPLGGRVDPRIKSEDAHGEKNETNPPAL